MDDKKKIFILKTIIIVVSIVLFSFIGLLVLVSTSDHKYNNSVKTTARRTYKTTEAIEGEIIEFNKTEEDEEKTTNTTTSLPTTTTTIKTTNQITQSSVITTKKVIITTKVTESITEPIEEKRNIVTTNSNYEGVNNTWVWTIFENINNERVKNGLNKVLMDGDMRSIAEEAANMYDGNNGAEVKQFIGMRNGYMYASNNLSSTGFNTLSDNTIKATSLGKNNAYQYVGIAVIEKNNGMGGVHTYYYVILYE